MIYSTMFGSYLLFYFELAFELYALAYSFMLCFNKYLLELICYLICNASFFYFKIFVIYCVKLVLVIIVIDKPVLYYW